MQLTPLRVILNEDDGMKEEENNDDVEHASDFTPMKTIRFSWELFFHSYSYYSAAYHIRRK